MTDPHVITLDSRRVLGLSPGANLPAGVQGDQIRIDVVALARWLVADFDD